MNDKQQEVKEKIRKILETEIKGDEYSWCLVCGDILTDLDEEIRMRRMEIEEDQIEDEELE